MDRETRKLKQFQEWFRRYVAKHYGKKCPDFTWSCALCHAHFVKGLLDDFVQDTVALDKWGKRQKKGKSPNKHRH